jgi:XisI protein
MEKLIKYRQIIQEVLRDYAATPISNGDIESQTIFDSQQDHYQVLDIGWDGSRRVHGCVLHLDIKDGKIWIQHNMTEMRIAHVLVAKGVAKEDIILGFQIPYVREYTGFGVEPKK